MSWWNKINNKPSQKEGKVELSLGKGKLELKNNGNVKLNEANIRDLYGRVIRGAVGSSGKERLERINIEWIAYDETFFTPNTDLVMPGFGNIKYSECSQILQRNWGRHIHLYIGYPNIRLYWFSGPPIWKDDRTAICRNSSN